MHICFVGEICISGKPNPLPGWPPQGGGSTSTSSSGNPPPSKTPPNNPEPTDPWYGWHPLQPLAEFKAIELYPEFLTDVTTLEAIHHATRNIADDVTRAAVQLGTDAALRSLRKRVAKKVHSIEFSE